MLPVRVRFTLRRLMVAVAVVGVASWMVTSLAKIGAARLYDQIAHPSLHLALAFPTLAPIILIGVLTVIMSLLQQPRPR